MRFNLIEERWIPVVRSDGMRDSIAPWELTRGDPPVVDLAPPRPDFRAALMELLIGLLQTAMPPAKVKGWQALLDQPPTPDALRQALAPHAPFFNLFGDKPLFMQDLELAPPAKASDRTDVASLLIDAPGQQTIRRNTDLFIRRGQVPALCPACAAMALYTLQAFAPAGGAGIRTSLRGGGPLSTLAERGSSRAGQEHQTLWDKLWLNVLPANSTHARLGGAPAPADLPGKVYPWGAPTRTSEKGQLTHPTDVHPLQAYWGMPRRILLLPEDADGGEACSLCHSQERLMVRSYFARPRGTNYGDTWRHPLTPYREQGQGKPTLAVKGTASIAGYGHWLGIVYGQGAEQGVRRAACVANALSMPRGREPGTMELAVAGYDMDNAKALQWCESRFPYYHVDEELLPEFRRMVDMLVLAADAVRKNLVGLLKEALVNEAGRNQAKVDKTLFEAAGSALWARTEAQFYSMTQELAQAPDMESSDPLRARWADVLMFTARDLFEEATGRGRIKPERWERIVEAGRKLDNFNRKKTRTLLALPNTGGSK